MLRTRVGLRASRTTVADDEVGIVLIETVTTAHTGAAVIDSTVPIERQVGSAQGRLRAAPDQLPFL